MEGPKGPHLFRSSQSSAELDASYALQMSPLLPKDMPSRTATAFSDDTVTPVAYQPEAGLSIDAILAKPETRSPGIETVRKWTPRQVADWFFKLGADEDILEALETNDIDGVLLLNLTFEDLLGELEIGSFGKRHLVWDEIGRLRGDVGGLSPQPTPFQDISRPCTTNTNKRSPSRSRNACKTPVGDDASPFTPSGGKKRRGRKAPKTQDVVTPAESVSIVAIEQLVPKEHKCSKGERCAKWRKQQRENKRMEEDNAYGRFPISPTKGGRIMVAGDPGNATIAENIVPNVHKAPSEDPFRPASNVIPSMVASSDVLGQSRLPFALHPDMLDQVEKRDPQDNVRHFLTFQHIQSPNDIPPSPPPELAEPGSIPRSESVPLFPAHHFQAYPSLNAPMRSHTPGPRDNLKALPRLQIPRSQTAAPQMKGVVSPEALTSACRSVSPGSVYRLGTPASEMDVPVTAIPVTPVARDNSQSVPPNMHYHQQVALSRSQSTRGVPDWRRPSMALPALKEGEVLSPSDPKSRPSLSTHNSSDSQSSSRRQSIRDPAHHSPNKQSFGYGPDCTHAGWMKKRKTKMLRHEWQETHCRLNGTELAMHADAHFHSAKKDTINVDEYAVACSSVASTNKLSAAMKAFHIKNNAEAPKRAKNEADPTAFAFQLVPSKDGDKKGAANAKTHHFAVKSKDERIDWMRELMLAKALHQKGKGYDVEVNGVQA